MEATKGTLLPYTGGGLRTELYADPHNLFLHNLVLETCRRHPTKTAIVDTSCGRRLSYAELGETVERLARGFVAAGVQPGDVVAIFLCNCWEFCAAVHAVTLAGGIQLYSIPPIASARYATSSRIREPYYLLPTVETSMA